MLGEKARLPVYRIGARLEKREEKNGFTVFGEEIWQSGESKPAPGTPGIVGLVIRPRPQWPHCNVAQCGASDDSKSRHPCLGEAGGWNLFLFGVCFSVSFAF